MPSNDAIVLNGRSNDRKEKRIKIRQKTVRMDFGEEDVYGTEKKEEDS